jgi:hypothetical protein
MFLNVPLKETKKNTRNLRVKDVKRPTEVTLNHRFWLLHISEIGYPRKTKISKTRLDINDKKEHLLKSNIRSSFKITLVVKKFPINVDKNNKNPVIKPVINEKDKGLNRSTVKKPIIMH